MAPPKYRSLLELATKRAQWTCSRCTKSQPTTFISSTSIRRLQTGKQRRAGTVPTMEEMRKPFENRNKNTLCVTVTQDSLAQNRFRSYMKFSFDVLPNSFTSCNMLVWGASRWMLMSALSDKIRVPRGICFDAKAPRPALAVWRIESMIVMPMD